MTVSLSRFRFSFVVSWVIYTSVTQVAPHCPDSHLIWQDSFTEDARIQSITVPYKELFFLFF